MKADEKRWLERVDLHGDFAKTNKELGLYD